MSNLNGFPSFYQLPAELQVEIIKYALDEEVRLHGNKFLIYLQINDPSPETPKASPLTTIKSIFRRHSGHAESLPGAHLAKHNIKLPKLPSIYHVSHLFRADALRIYPLRQTIGCPALSPSPLGSMAFVEPKHDTLNVIIHDRRSKNTKILCFCFFFQSLSKDTKAHIAQLTVIYHGLLGAICFSDIKTAMADPDFRAIKKSNLKIIAHARSCSHWRGASSQGTCNCEAEAKTYSLEWGAPRWVQV